MKENNIYQMLSTSDQQKFTNSDAPCTAEHMEKVLKGKDLVMTLTMKDLVQLSVVLEEPLLSHVQGIIELFNNDL